MSQKRVVHLIESLEPYGAERLMAFIAVGLRHAFSPTVVTFFGGELEGVLSQADVPVKIMAPGPPGRMGIPKRFQLCRQVLAELRPDLVHTYLIYGDVCGRMAAHSLGIPTVCHLQGWNGKAGSLAYRLGYRIAHSKRSRVIAVSDGVARKFHECVGILPRTVYNAVDEERLLADAQSPVDTREVLGLPPNAFVVATVARLVELKNHKALLRCAARVCERADDVHFICAGDGPLLDELIEMRDRLGLTDRVHFPGYCQDVGRLLRDAEVFCLMSRGEGFGLGIAEAMFMRCGVVATDVMGIREIVETGVQGFLVPDDDDEAAAKRLLELHGDRSLLKRQAEAGHTRAREAFSREALLRNIEGVYQELLGGPG
ncbi:MAG: glycosyltransferase [Armatimonadetes bacterium]|nr:glycosyltransferase [Armatimonadota bacterium]